MMAKKKDEKEDETVWDWRADLDEWLDDMKQELPLGDGSTIYPEKVSCQKDEHDKIASITQLLFGRVGAFRASGFYLPNSERWSVPDDEKCVIIDCGSGWMFSVAAGMRNGLMEWARDLASTGVIAIQDTLSDKHGYAIYSVQGKDLPHFWFGRPRRTGYRYVIAGSKEDVK